MPDRSRISLLLVITGIVLISVAIAPALGDIAYSTDTYTYFSQDGHPFNGSVQFSVACYGHYTYPNTPAFFPNYTPDNENETVFSYSATCPGYGCVIHEPYYLNYRHIRQCDLSGTAGGYSFSVVNFSDTPKPSTCTMTRSPFDMTVYSGEDTRYYNVTPEYDTCINETYRELERCDQYLAKYDPAAEPDSESRIISEGNYYKDTPRSLACRKAANSNHTACESYLETVNMTGRELPPTFVCEQYFTIPGPGTGNATSYESGPGAGGSGPVQSLICRILSLFTVRC